MGSKNTLSAEGCDFGRNAYTNQAFEEISEQSVKCNELSVYRSNEEQLKRVPVDLSKQGKVNAKEEGLCTISDNIETFGYVNTNGIQATEKIQPDNHRNYTKTELSIIEDSFWSWIVCAGCFLYFSIYGAIFLTFGMVFIELVDEFDSGKGDTAWIISINLALSLLPGPVASFLGKRFGYWVIAVTGSIITVTGMLASLAAKNIQTLYLTYGLVAGFGHGFMYHTSVVCVILSFDKKKSFATGIANAGIGVGIFVISPVIEACLQAYGWKGTILIEAGLLLNGLVCGLTYRPVEIPNTTSCQEKAADCKHSASGNKYRSPRIAEYKTNQNADYIKRNECTSLEGADWLTHFKQKVCSITVLSPLRSLPFVLFLLSTTLMYLAIYMPLLFIPDLAKTKGIDGRQRAWLLSASGIAGTASRIIFGWLADRSCVDEFVIQSTACVLCGVFSGLMPFCDSFKFLLGDVIAFSTFSGFIPALVSVLIAELIGRDKVSEGFALVCWFSGLSNMLGPPIAGWLFDFFGEYQISFWSFGVVFILSGSILYIVGCLNCRGKTSPLSSP